MPKVTATRSLASRISDASTSRPTAIGPRDNRGYYFHTHARNEETGLPEDVRGHARTFKDVARRRKPYKPSEREPHSNPLTQEERDAIFIDSILDAIKKREDHEHLQAQRLADRIEQRSLLERMEVPVPHREDVPVEIKPLPQDLNFKKTKIIARHSEYATIWRSATGRLEPFIIRFENEERRLGRREDGSYKEDSEEIRRYKAIRGMLDKIWDWGGRLTGYEPKLSNKQWRLLKGDFKSLGRIDLKEPERRWMYITKSLEDLAEKNPF